MLETKSNMNINEQLNKCLESGEDIEIEGEKFVRAIVKEQGKEAELKMVSTKLESLQEAVRGWIEVVAAPFCENLDIIINEEGKFIEEEKPNFFLPEYDDVIVGNAIFVGFDMDSSDHISITDEQIESITAYLNKNTITNEIVDKEDYIRYAIYRM